MKKKIVRRFKKYRKEIENPKSFFTYKRAKMIIHYLGRHSKLFPKPFLGNYYISFDLMSLSKYAKRTGKCYFVLWKYKV